MFFDSFGPKETSKPQKLQDLKEVKLNAERLAAYKHLRNNSVHNAVLANDIKTVERILESKSSLDAYLLLSVTSKLNTPLILALKLGQTEMALLLLKYPMDIHATDCRGLSALDWACILRCDEVIKEILQRKFDFGEIEDIDELPLDSFASVLYAENFGSFNSFLEFIDKNKTDYFSENDKPLTALGFNGREILADIKYFMKELCVNQKYMNENDFKKADSHLSSSARFLHAFFIGQKTFCTKRDSKPCDPELLEAMQSEEDLEKYREKNPKQNPSSRG
jgi:hypothetical protein